MEFREDCPCTKIKCKNHCYCEPCRAKHYAKDGLPYCERPGYLKKLEKPSE